MTEQQQQIRGDTSNAKRLKPWVKFCYIITLEGVNNLLARGIIEKYLATGYLIWPVSRSWLWEIVQRRIYNDVGSSSSVEWSWENWVDYFDKEKERMDSANISKMFKLVPVFLFIFFIILFCKCPLQLRVCYRLNVYTSPKFKCWNFNTQYDDIEK